MNYALFAMKQRAVGSWLTTDSGWPHYSDVIMGAMASQITSLAIVYSTDYSGADQSKHQSSASLPYVWGVTGDRWIPHTKGQWRGRCFHHACHSIWVMCHHKHCYFNFIIYDKIGHTAGHNCCCREGLIDFILWSLIFPHIDWHGDELNVCD